MALAGGQQNTEKYMSLYFLWRLDLETVCILAFVYDLKNYNKKRENKFNHTPSHNMIVISLPVPVYKEKWSVMVSWRHLKIFFVG